MCPNSSSTCPSATGRLCADCAEAPLTGGYYDSEDVPAISIKLCRECNKRNAVLPRGSKSPNFCSLECVINYCDPKSEEYLDCEHIREEIKARVEKNNYDLLDLMRLYSHKTLSLEDAYITLERALRSHE